MLTAEEIQKNWEIQFKIIKKFISEDRFDNIFMMLNQLQDRIILAPASGKHHFHNAFPGGYLDHVINVVRLSLKVKELWSDSGTDINFTDEELVFSALFHDLGKIGDGKVDGYIPQTDKWRQEKLGEIYTTNTELDFMLTQDRSLFLLQKYNIPVTLNEYIAIKVHDGLFDDTNKPYYISYNPDSKFRTHLPEILHQADILATRFELDRWKRSQEDTNFKVNSPKKSKNKPSSEGLKNLVKNL